MVHMYMERHHVEYRLSMQWLDKWVTRWQKAACREMSRLHVYNLYVKGYRGHVCSDSFDATHLWHLPPGVQCLLCCPHRADWKSVALPLQSYHSAAAGVTSSALPLCSLPDSFLLLLLFSLERLTAATCWFPWWIPSQCQFCLWIFPFYFTISFFYAVLKLNCVTLQEFPSSQQPLQPHHAAAGLVGWSCHTPIQPDAQCGSCTCHEAALNQ